MLLRKFPLERGPTRPQKSTIVEDCAQIAESDLTPPFESPHLDFPKHSSPISLFELIFCLRGDQGSPCSKRSPAKKWRKKWQKRQKKWHKSDQTWRKAIELLLPTSFCVTLKGIGRGNEPGSSPRRFLQFAGVRTRPEAVGGRTKLLPTLGVLSPHLKCGEWRAPM